MQYLIFIHKDDESDYGVIVPDLPGCYSAGKSIEEAIHNTHEAIECHLEGLLLDGDVIPLKQSFEQHLDNPELQDGVLAVVEIDLSKISGKSRRINITVPERFLEQIDQYTKEHGSNRSAFLLDAAMSFMAEHGRVSS
ncbi:MAG: hypothetical protein K0Q74_672 [Gammaproteobacteria bacterium]|jgi:predicted RNase H-like HicB family nuclease|nr:hypothetical protein [Gammaproteobacteria bacterium]